MKKKKIIKSTVISAAVIGLTYAVNKLVFYYSTMKALLSSDSSHFYHWRFGDIYYVEKGEGTPILLIHDLSHTSSAYEWRSLVDTLSEKHHVYAVDLLGCGHSQKPKITYTNYLYVQLLNDFVRDVIKGKTDVMTSGSSASLALMACHMEPELYNRLMFINPDMPGDYKKIPKVNHKALKYIIEIPLAGTFIYNLCASYYIIKKCFEKNYFYDKDKIKKEAVGAFHEAAHLGGPSARYLYASVRSHYTNIDISRALRACDHSIFIISSRGKAGGESIAECYLALNPAVETASIEHAGCLPHMEMPEKVLELCDIFF